MSIIPILVNCSEKRIAETRKRSMESNIIL